VTRNRSIDLTAVIVILLLGVLFFSDIPQIPFHPDEASLLFQSRDFEVWLRDPLELSFNPNLREDVAQTYRILNPPLPKYILAMGRNFAGFGPERVSVDWDWSLTWEENSVTGALPTSDLLNASRVASTIMVALSLIVIYLCGKRIHSPTLGLIAVVLLGTNALVLLHGRRAMAEGTLLFGISLALLGILEGDKKPWFAGLGSAIAVCSKLSAGALIPIALVSVLPFLSNPIPSRFRQPQGKTSFFLKFTSRIQPAAGFINMNLRRTIHNIIVFILSFVIVYTLLSPLIWKNPFQAIQAQWMERKRFLQTMTDEFKQYAPNQVLDDPTERISVLITHLFIQEPQFAEVGNYSEATSATEKDYSNSFFSSLFRGYFWGSLFLTITLLGVAFWILDFRNLENTSKRITLLLFFASLALLIALIWAIPLLFQRYYVPLLPITTLWLGLGFVHSTQITKKAISKLR
jgi:4-amino-4-deoxy-L-arabinose transferase-like glycosyltransferase